MDLSLVGGNTRDVEIVVDGDFVHGGSRRLWTDPVLRRHGCAATAE
ncbi:MAG: hypothetical protein ACYS0H_14750 [Planctomycetota bacterium]